MRRKTVVLRRHCSHLFASVCLRALLARGGDERAVFASARSEHAPLSRSSTSSTAAVRIAILSEKLRPGGSTPSHASVKRSTGFSTLRARANAGTRPLLGPAPVAVDPLRQPRHWRGPSTWPCDAQFMKRGGPAGSSGTVVRRVGTHAFSPGRVREMLLVDRKRVVRDDGVATCRYFRPKHGDLQRVLPERKTADREVAV
jgi:hypothetical protein